MIINALTSGLPDRIEADVVIIGSGPAGIVVALELAAAGQEVIVVEAGGDHFSRSSQAIYRAETVSPEAHGQVDMFRRRMLGGSSTLWGGRCIPFDPIDFEARPWLRHARWPVSYEEVARFYPKALEYAEAGEPLFDAGSALPGSPAALAPGVTSGDVVLDRIERFSRPSDFARAHGQQLRTAPGLRLYYNAPVEHILTHSDGNHAAGVRLRVGNRSVEIAATRVVIAAGGLETVRLLLASDEARSCGLGNERELVGRFYQCHLEGEIGTIAFPARATESRIDYQRATDGTYCRRYLWLSPEAQRRDKLAGLVLRPSHANIVDPNHRDPVLSAMYLTKSLIVREYARKMTSLEAVARDGYKGGQIGYYSAHLRNVILGSPRLAAFGVDWTRRRILASRKLPSVVLVDRRARYPIDVNAEQEPNPDSRITLGGERDALGMRRLRIDWRTTADDHHRLAEGMRVIQRAIEPSGTVRIEFGPDLESLTARRVPVGGHHIGTARMARDASTGVCDANAELFETRGLFIAGAAALATSSFANPTLVLLALALRLAEHLAVTGPQRTP
jgi:choline dehydrogenase-like flavoprotein